MVLSGCCGSWGGLLGSVLLGAVLSACHVQGAGDVNISLWGAGLISQHSLCVWTPSAMFRAPDFDWATCKDSAARMLKVS